MRLALFQKAGLSLTAIMLWQAPAFADCPETALQSTADSFNALSQPGNDATETLETVDSLIEVCPHDPHVLKIAAIIYASAPSPDAETSVGRLTTSLNLIHRMWDNLDGNPTRYVTDQNGKKVLIGFLDLYDIEKQILNALLQAEQISGVQSTFTHPPAGSDTGKGCKTMDNIMVSIASLWIQQQGEHPGAYSLMDHLIARCEADLADRRYTRMLGSRAKALLASVQRDPGQDGALEKAAQAKADSERFVELFGGYDNAGWLKSNDLALEQATATAVMANQTFTLSKELFLPPQLNAPGAKHALALMFDKAWAEDAEEGLSGGYASYRDLVRTAYDLTGTLDDPGPARRMLFEAARAHAEGEVRVPGNESLEAPPDFLYKWVKSAELE